MSASILVNKVWIIVCWIARSNREQTKFWSWHWKRKSATSDSMSSAREIKSFLDCPTAHTHLSAWAAGWGRHNIIALLSRSPPQRHRSKVCWHLKFKMALHAEPVACGLPSLAKAEKWKLWVRRINKMASQHVCRLHVVLLLGRHGRVEAVSAMPLEHTETPTIREPAWARHRVKQWHANQSCSADQSACHAQRHQQPSQYRRCAR